MYEAYEALKVRSEGGVVHVTLDNPPMNGMSSAMHRELGTVFARIGEDRDARVVVFTGAGERAFNAGGDPAKLASGPGDDAEWLERMREARAIVLGMLRCDVPVIGRLNGHAIGVGATIALCCDVTVMVDTAKIGDTHVKIGLSAGDGGSLLWPHIVGMMTAKRFLLTGDLLTGREAAAAGLVTEAVSRDALDTRTQAWIDKFLVLPPMAVRLTKRSLNMALCQQAEAFMDAHLGLETLTHMSADFREAGAATREGRSAAFVGR